MSKFRLLMATQTGERVARDAGFTDFPVIPHVIAAVEDIDIVAKPADRKGVSGGIIFTGDDVTIFYATDIDNDGFQRFTIAHELGHYYLPGHPEEIQTVAPVHVSRAGFSEGTSSIEIEADHFAAGLLMPSALVRRTLRHGPIGLEGILRLAEVAETSVTAAAIRAAECIDYPLAIIVSQGRTVAYSFLSDSFRQLKPSGFLRKGDALPPCGTRAFNADEGNVRRADRRTNQTRLRTWYDAPTDLDLDEEIIGLGSYGYTLTVLSSEELPDNLTEEPDEEAELIESWTPRFARGR